MYLRKKHLTSQNQGMSKTFDRQNPRAPVRMGGKEMIEDGTWKAD